MAHVLFGYIARETDKAVAFVDGNERLGVAPLWIPRAKIEAEDWPDTLDIDIQLKGEEAHRSATPVTLKVDSEFMIKINR